MKELLIRNVDFCHAKRRKKSGLRKYINVHPKVAIMLHCPFVVTNYPCAIRSPPSMEAGHSRYCQQGKVT